MRFGIGWRPELGAGILANLDRIDVVEVLAEDFVSASRRKQKALQFLSRLVPVVVHATSLGLASSEPTDRKRLDDLARVVALIEPDFWSEHLAFVRASGTEVGHLAAPPRNAAILEGLIRNVTQARAVVGSGPLLENVATLVDPPLSTYDEATWLNAVASETGCPLLLDLHNLHANATNFGFDAHDVLARVRHEHIGAIHIAGGRRIEDHRLLDDHRHAVPPEVFQLLKAVDASAATLILERDGNYPSIDFLLAEIDHARSVVATASSPSSFPAAALAAAPPPHPPSSPSLLAFLARLYTNDDALARFSAAPAREAIAAGLLPEEGDALSRINADDLAAAARSFARKRQGRGRAVPTRWYERLFPASRVQ